MKPLLALIVHLVIISGYSVKAQPFKDLVPNYSRTKSVVMGRSISIPTRANLDYTAYTGNPVRFNPEKQKPKKPAKPVTIDDMTFKGALQKVVPLIEQTPLTKEEINAPLAWAPLMNLLWTEHKADGLKKIGAVIISEKWEDPSIYLPYQDIAALYLHSSGDKVEYWVKIEFMPWVHFLKGIQDVDKDGFPEIYGLLSTGSIDKLQLDRSITWIKNEYTAKILTREEIVDWANVLASYWYPTLNTDIVDLGGATVWPVSETEGKVKKTLKKLSFKDPVAVIRGNPYGTVLYNVFTVPGSGKSISAKIETAAKQSDTVHTLDMSVSENFKQNEARFGQELKPYGDYDGWAKAVASVQDGLKKVLDGTPANQMGIIGKDGWLFFRKSIEYILASDLSQQTQDKNPVPYLSEFKKYCDHRGVNFLFVAVPCKEELYYEQLGIHANDTSGPIIAPYGRKILADLQKNGIEVIDLLAAFLHAKVSDTSSTEPIYQKQDTHWSHRGLRIAAQMIADRIKRYAWYDSIANRRVAYSYVDTTCLRQGDIVERIPESDRLQYPVDTLRARQIVTPEGKKFRSDAGGPLLLIGDSYTGVFELVDCKSAGIGANIAALTGLPVDILTSWGGGPMIMNKAVKLRDKTMPQKRLIVYMMTARDLYNYAQGWEQLKVE